MSVVHRKLAITDCSTLTRSSSQSLRPTVTKRRRHMNAIWGTNVDANEVDSCLSLTPSAQMSAHDRSHSLPLLLSLSRCHSQPISC